MWWGEEGVCVGLFFLPLKVYLKVDILLPASPDLRILVIEGECWTAGLVHYLCFLSLQDLEGGDYPNSCLLGNARGEGKLPSWVDGLTSERLWRERNADVLIPCGPFLPSLTQKGALNRKKTVPLQKIVHVYFWSSCQPANIHFYKSLLPFFLMWLLFILSTDVEEGMSFTVISLSCLAFKDVNFVILNLNILLGSFLLVTFCLFD